MLAEHFEKLTDELAEQVVAKAGPKLIAYLNDHRPNRERDELFTIKEAAEYLGKSSNTIRRLVECGELHRAPGIAEINIRRSELDKYGTSPQPNSKR